jgi:hypothetical protein
MVSWLPLGCWRRRHGAEHHGDSIVLDAARNQVVRTLAKRRWRKSTGSGRSVGPIDIHESLKTGWLLTEYFAQWKLHNSQRPARQLFRIGHSGLSPWRPRPGAKRDYFTRCSGRCAGSLDSVNPHAASSASRTSGHLSSDNVQRSAPMRLRWANDT